MTAPQSRKLTLVPGRRQWHITRHEDDVSDHQLDWSRFMNESEGISSVATSASNVTVDSTSISGQTTTIFLSGGTNETEGYVDVTITTDNATARKFTVRLRVYNSNYTGAPKAGIWQ